VLKILGIPDDFNTCYFYRMFVPGCELNRNPDFEFRVINHTLFSIELLEAMIKNEFRPDLIILQRLTEARYIKMLPELKARGIKVVVELDDNFWAIPPDNPFCGISSRAHLLTELICQADGCIVSCEQLRKLCSAWNDRTEIIPNYLPDEYFDLEKNHFQKTRVAPLVMAWFGSFTHFGELQMIERAIRKLSKKHGSKFKFIYADPLARCPDWLKPYKPLCITGVEPIEFVPVLTSLAVDIALAPVKDNEFNRCKTPLKMLEYGVSKFAVISSDVGEYKKYSNEIGLTANRPEAWADKVQELADNIELRRTLAQSLYNRVDRESRISLGVKRWIEVIDRMIAC